MMVILNWMFCVSLFLYTILLFVLLLCIRSILTVGPEFDRGVTRRAVLLGDPLSLVCGRNLVSNPMATVEWRDPNEILVLDNARYDLEDGPEVIRLSFTRTIEADDGEWACRVRVADTDVSVVQNNELVIQPTANIGTETVRITLTVVGKV